MSEWLVMVGRLTKCDSAAANNCFSALSLVAASVRRSDQHRAVFGGTLVAGAKPLLWSTRTTSTVTDSGAPHLEKEYLREPQLHSLWRLSFFF